MNSEKQIQRTKNREVGWRGQDFPLGQQPLKSAKFILLSWVSTEKYVVSPGCWGVLVNRDVREAWSLEKEQGEFSWLRAWYICYSNLVKWLSCILHHDVVFCADYCSVSPQFLIVFLSSSWCHAIQIFRVVDFDKLNLIAYRLIFVKTGFFSSTSE